MKKKMQMGQLSHLAHFSRLHNTPQCSQTKHSWLQPWEGLGKAWALQWRRPFSTARNRHFFHLSNSSLCKRAQDTGTFLTVVVVLCKHHSFTMHYWDTAEHDPGVLNSWIQEKKILNLSMSETTELPHHLAAVFWRRRESNISIQHT